MRLVQSPVAPGMSRHARRTRRGVDPADPGPLEARLQHRLDDAANELAADFLAAIVHRRQRRLGQVAGAISGGGPDHHLHLGLLDVEEPLPVLPQEVREPAGVQQLEEKAPGVGDEREVDDVCHVRMFIAWIAGPVQFPLGSVASHALHPHSGPKFGPEE